MSPESQCLKLVSVFLPYDTTGEIRPIRIVCVQEINQPGQTKLNHDTR